MQDNNPTVIAIDYGNKRIGLAIASLAARLARPYKTLPNDQDFLPSLKEIIDSENATTLVVGYPRDINGNTTEQTRLVDDFLLTLTGLGIEIITQDEALTSKQAEAELEAKKTSYTKEDVDSLAATIILDDYLNTLKG